MTNDLLVASKDGQGHNCVDNVPLNKLNGNERRHNEKLIKQKKPEWSMNKGHTAALNMDESVIYSKICLKWPLENGRNKDLNDKW